LEGADAPAVEKLPLDGTLETVFELICWRLSFYLISLIWKRLSRSFGVISFFSLVSINWLRISWSWPFNYSLWGGVMLVPADGKVF
jgi:hypothetical protein